MKRFFIAFCFIASFCKISASVDTTYFNNDGQEVHPALADYLRIAVRDTAKDSLYQFIDRKKTGEKLASGSFRKTSDGIRYEGLLKTYSVEGQTLLECHYKNGELEGEQYEYDGKGGKTTKLYKQGVLQGDFYFHESADGKKTKYSARTGKMVWESPSVEQRKEAYSHGTNWQYYVANNIVIDAACTSIKDYGKWHRIDLCITNGSDLVLDLDPATMFKCRVDEFVEYAWTYDEFMKRIRSQQAWAAAAAGFAAGLNAYNASYTTSTVTTTTYSRGRSYTSFSTVRTYNPAGAALVIAQNQMMFSQLDMAQRAANAERSNYYFRRTTINPGESVSGYVLIERARKDKKVIVKTYINGTEYQFDWNVVK